ncbi:MAG: multidrug MFS transporter [Patescibacteria group bacterium]|nr:MAG: multidrug MFS transporter [Patescibacteria group bacterium]
MLKKILFRSLEIFFSLMLLLLLSPFFILIVLIIKLTSKGSVFFIQKRAGLNMKPFYIIKFRTMIEKAEEIKKKIKKLNEAKGPVFKIKNDPRYTLFGKWLAKRGLDELPQIINILKGEMSFVGPRPLPIDEAKKVPKKYEKRFSVKPGIISTWAVNGAFHNDFDRWMRMDLEDIKNKSFYYDLSIILKGIKLLFIYLLKAKNGEK